MTEKILLRNTQSLGDLVVLSAAVRDLHKCHPGRFEFCMDTSIPEVFRHNPGTVSFPKSRGRQVVARYDRHGRHIHRSNQHGAHFLWSFLDDLNVQLGSTASLTDFRGDLHLTAEEKNQPLVPRPYWLFASGGKRDYVTKWWDPASWAEVVRRMRPWTAMVQVGGGRHVHPRIDGVTDLVGKTSVRDLFRLIRHAEGVLCAVTSLMHIAACFNKPCVVVAGGREHWTWEAYTAENRLAQMRMTVPGWQPPAGDSFIPHRFLHTIGQLDCCRGFGCWKSAVELPKIALQDPEHGRKTSEAKDRLCVWTVPRPAGRLPKCLENITPDMVLDGVERYYQDGILTRGAVPVFLPAPGHEVRLHAAPPGPCGVSPAAPPAVRPDPLPQGTVGLFAYVGASAARHAGWLAGVTAGRQGCPVTVVIDGPDDAAAECRGPEVRVVADPGAPGRTNLMRSALHGAEGWVLWLEPTASLRPGWGRRLDALRKRSAECVAGLICTHSATTLRKELARTAPWGKGLPPAVHALRGGEIINAPAGGCFAAPAALLRRLGWPDGRAPEEESDIMLGEAARQHGVPLADIGDMLEWS